jgi:uncharacterized protein YfaS (alpha-2-macroglobulin family)
LADIELLSAILRGPAETESSVTALDDTSLSPVPRDTTVPLEVSARGGALYYTAILRYDLPAELAGARDEGLSVYTELMTVGGDRLRTNILSLGTTYRRRVVVSTSKRRSYVVVSVPVPTGAEILDVSFKTTGSYAEQIETADSGAFRPRPIEKVFRNEVRYYFDDVAPGIVEVDFFFRTTNRGAFPTPPATAECMYEPEVFGRSEGALYIIRQ